jgi:crotonobetainyl-CoA:carnitine CoA-transferase CaiB-like acyl-CoA transferase
MQDKAQEIHEELNRLQAAYKAAVDEWVTAIREEEALASAADHSVADLDKWEEAHMREHKMHRNVIYTKRLYEDALRREFYGF